MRRNRRPGPGPVSRAQCTGRTTAVGVAGGARSEDQRRHCPQGTARWGGVAQTLEDDLAAYGAEQRGLYQLVFDLAEELPAGTPKFKAFPHPLLLGQAAVSTS